MKILDSSTQFDQFADNLVIKRQQEIPQWFIDQLREIKGESKSKREGNFMLVASVPTIIHEQWLKEGFDMTSEPYRETLKRLRALHLDDFIATNKSI
jgi:hypothetical protein